MPRFLGFPALPTCAGFLLTTGLCAFAHSGVFRAREGGSWQKAGQGMPEGKARSLAIDGNRLVAGLEAGSVWELQSETVALAPTGIFRKGTGIWRRADGRALPSGKAIIR